MISWSDLPPWIAIALSLGALLRAHFGARTKEVDLRIGVVAAKVDLAEDRIVKLEADMAHLPDKDVTHRLEMALSDMKSEVGKLTERMKPIAAMADRIQEAMVDKVMS